MSKPWMVKEAIEEIERRLTPESVVFEWGSGGSTIWFAERCKYIESVEHDKSFFQDMLMKIPENVNLKYRPLVSDYYEAIAFHQQYDMIVVDGRMRVRCIREAIPCLKMGGTLVLDNSERSEYEAGIAMMDGWPKVSWRRGWETALFTKTEEREPGYYDEILERIGIKDEIA